MPLVWTENQIYANNAITGMYMRMSTACASVQRHVRSFVARCVRVLVRMLCVRYASDMLHVRVHIRVCVTACAECTHVLAGVCMCVRACVCVCVFVCCVLPPFFPPCFLLRDCLCYEF